MKKITALLILLMPLFAVAQTFPTKPTPSNGISGVSPYGHTSINYTGGTTCTIVLGTVTPVSGRVGDTLVSPATGAGGYATDSGYVQYLFNDIYGLTIDLAVTKISGTLAGTAVLQGSIDNATWHTLTGNTTYCTDCIGASATITNTTGTKHYQWQLPKETVIFPYFQIAPILSGTCTASFTAQATYVR